MPSRVVVDFHARFPAMQAVWESHALLSLLAQSESSVEDLQQQRKKCLRKVGAVIGKEGSLNLSYMDYCVALY